MVLAVGACLLPSQPVVVVGLVLATVASPAAPLSFVQLCQEVKRLATVVLAKKLHILSKY